MAEGTETRRPNLKTFARRIPLERTSEMLEAGLDDPQFVENVIYRGFDELITRFNAMSEDDPDLELTPSVVELKAKLGAVTLPSLGDLSSHDLLVGIQQAAKYMKMGEMLKKGEIPSNYAHRAVAIGSPSMDTNTRAILVGTGGHLLERIIFSHLRKLGLGGWTKDDVLFALEDIVLLMHAETVVGPGYESPLFPYITSPNSMDETGGLGWRNQDQVKAVVAGYNRIHNPAA